MNNITAVLPMDLDGYTLELADLDLMNSVLDTVNISDRARNFIVSGIPHLRDGPNATGSAIDSALGKAIEIRLVAGSGQDDSLTQGIQGLDDIQAKKVLQGLLDWNTSSELGNPAAQLGQRSSGEVVERMLRKVRGSDTELNLRKALELAAELARGYLRLTQKGPNCAVPEPGEPQKELDVLRRESPHDDHEIRHGKPPWTTPSSAESTRFGR